MRQVSCGCSVEYAAVNVRGALVEEQILVLEPQPVVLSPSIDAAYRKEVVKQLLRVVLRGVLPSKRR